MAGRNGSMKSGGPSRGGASGARSGRSTLDGAALGGLIAAGVLGFAVARMLPLQRTDSAARRASESNDRKRLRKAKSAAKAEKKAKRQERLDTKGEPQEQPIEMQVEVLRMSPERRAKIEARRAAKRLKEA